MLYLLDTLRGIDRHSQALINVVLAPFHRDVYALLKSVCTFNNCDSAMKGISSIIFRASCNSS